MPRIFFGSSSEGAEQIHRVATGVCQGWAMPIVWTDAFPVGKTTLETLRKYAQEVDFAVFLSSGDDEITSRGITARVPRDNVVLETGLFMAKGPERVALLVPDKNTKISSDLAGYSHANYKESDPVDSRFTLATQQIREVFKERWESISAAGGSSCNQPVSCSESDVERDLDGIPWKDISALSLFCHTGTTLFREVADRLSAVFGPPKEYPNMRVLLRAPSIEGIGRNAAIIATLDRIHEIKGHGAPIDLHFYEALPMFRGLAYTRRSDGRTHVRHSSYTWNDHGHSKRAKYCLSGEISVTRATTLEDGRPKGSRSPAEAFSAWFEHFWGRDEIHTVVFDFDDTLVNSGGIQVEAWARTIDWALVEGLVTTENLVERVRRWVSGGRGSPIEMKRELTALFDEYQMAQDIMAQIFVGVPRSILVRLMQRRYDQRRSLMDGLSFYQGTVEHLRDLSEKYRLAIVSSTDERLIRDFLAAQRVGYLFGTILGKADPGLSTTRTIEDKAYLFLKLSVLTGVPLSRMVYVGDNRSDFNSTRQVGLTFVEARQAAASRGLRSLIGPVAGVMPPEWSFAEMKELPIILREISKLKTAAKWADM